MVDWIRFSERRPMPGQLCLITFAAAPTRVRVCYFDNVESYEAREGSLDIEVADEHLHGWFTEADDEIDWWGAEHIEYWAALALPQSPEDVPASLRSQAG